MSTSTLYYFVDTNLFIQCRPLEQINWSLWKTFEEVRLIVSSPVLREIDHLKNKGNNRVGNRARATSTMFRQLLNKNKIIHSEEPRVILSVESQYAYSEDLQDRLNYQERDDQLIGIIYEFIRCHQGSDARLLTHDTTPLFTAQGLNLTADMIPDDWLLSPENTETEKELAFLRNENARLKRAEPSFSIRCVDRANSEVESYCTSYTRFDPLSDAEIDELMQLLGNRFPMQTDFGPREPAERAAPQTIMNRFPGVKQIFTPVADSEIKNYRDKFYPQWLENCRDVLQNHHRALQQKEVVLEVSFFAKNLGIRPATDALITIEACGNFHIKPSPSDNHDKERNDEDRNDEDDELNERQEKTLPRPPIAPRGQWKMISQSPGHESLRALNALTNSLHGVHSGIIGHRFPDTPIIDPSSIFPLPSHDPNAFYYKPDRPEIPQSSFSLQCDQWRHDNEEYQFIFEVQMPADQSDVKGALVCRIQASNLSEPMSKIIPVTIKISNISAFESASSMVDTLLRIPS